MIHRTIACVQFFCIRPYRRAAVDTLSYTAPTSRNNHFFGRLILLTVSVVGEIMSATSKRDTPGRPKPSSSRQQTHADQVTQTGSEELDADSARRARKKKSKQANVKYRDRPTDDGKHGDGDDEPNGGFPSRGRT
jgi:hypothetical protein